jgi:glutathione reductase (NADPH)
MSAIPYDLVVVGGGSGGVRAAKTAASLGARVALVEEDRIGGTCVIRGCVPKKLMVLASRFAAEFDDARAFGWEMGTPAFHWQRLTSAVAREVSRLEGLYRKGLEDAGVAVFGDRGSLGNAGEVRLENAGSTLRCRHVLIATGSAPSPLAVWGGEHCITSDGFFALRRRPDRAVILGGGYIGVEFASLLRLLGAEVTILHHGASLLRGFDGALQDGLTGAFMDAGIRLHADTEASRIGKTGDELLVRDSNGALYRADCVINATGRKPRTAGLGLERCGVELDEAGAIRVDAQHRSTACGIFAVGDVTGRLNLTPVAIRQGQDVAHALFGGEPPAPMNHGIAPTAVFSTPELGTAGMTEAAARRSVANLKIFRTQFRPLRATLAGSAERMAIKVLVCGDTDKVLGIHILGREAAEMIQLAAVALQMGATKQDLDRTLAVHPTAAEELVTLRTASPVPFPQPAKERQA